MIMLRFINCQSFNHMPRDFIYSCPGFADMRASMFAATGKWAYDPLQRIPSSPLTLARSS